MDIGYPKEFEISPLADAYIEIRFDASDNKDFVAALIHNKLKTKFPKLKELPILQLPADAREREPGLKYLATYRMSSDDFYVSVGPNVLGVGCTIVDSKKKYPGWKVFLKQFLSVVGEVTELQIIHELERLSVRYVNFFQVPNLFDFLNVKVETGWENKGLSSNKNLTFMVENDKYTSRVIINTDVYKGEQSAGIKGQLIDIDTYYEDGLKVDTIGEIATNAHMYTEQVFFGLIGDELKVKLGAKYV